MGLKLPWEYQEALAEDEYYTWIVQYLNKKGLPLSCLNNPGKQKERQLKFICKSLLGSRNFILLVSQNPSYVIELYHQVAAIWTLTTELGFEIVDLISLNPFDYEFATAVYKYKEIGLLIIPYVDPTDYNLRRIKTTMGNIISYRKANNKPTITDTFGNSTTTNKAQLCETIKNLGNVFGDQAFPMFMDEKSNAKIIFIKRG